jgi:penicillin amidase
MNNAHNMVDFEKNLSLIHAPGLNINYGDAEGNVAWWACAALIERPAHVNSWTVLDGTSGVDDPMGFYPFEKNPRCINPEWGYIYSANDWPDKVNGEWYPGYYKPQYRADRIRHLIEKKNDWDLESMKSVMNDHKNVMDSMIMSTFADILVKNEKVANGEKGRALAIMDWNGSYDPISPSPTLFNAMIYNYLNLACADELGKEGFKLFLATHQFQRAQSKLLFTEDSPWWDNVNTPEVETRDQIIEQAYITSVDFLSEKFGSNPKIWNWRKAATLELKHPLGEVALFRPFFNEGPEPIYGGNETILQAGFKLDSTSEYKVFFGSQMRIMVDFAHVDSSLNVTPSGQSGHIMSKHYTDQSELYREMKFRPQWMKKKEGWDHLVFEGK